MSTLLPAMAAALLKIDTLGHKIIIAKQFFLRVWFDETVNRFFSNFINYNKINEHETSLLSMNHWWEEHGFPGHNRFHKRYVWGRYAGPAGWNVLLVGNQCSFKAEMPLLSMNYWWGEHGFPGHNRCQTGFKKDMCGHVTLSHWGWNVLLVGNQIGRFYSNFLAFLEYMNLIKHELLMGGTWISRQ